MLGRRPYSWREHLVTALKGIPAAATVRVERPDRAPVTVAGDIARAIEVVRTSPAGTSVSAKWLGGGVRYPRIK